MPTGLKTLGNDYVRSVRFKPSRLVYSRCRRNHPGAPSFYSFEKIRCGQAKVKAHDGGLKLAQKVGRFSVEWRTRPARADCVRIQAKLLVIGRKRRSPPSLPLWARGGRFMAKKVYVVRP